MTSCVMSVPYVDLAQQHAAIKNELMDAMGHVLDGGKFVLGSEVHEFEEKFAQLCGVRFALGLNSGTDALILALKSLNIGAGDEVIAVANSFVSSVSCIMAVGARPVFVDVNAESNMDPRLIEQAITPKTKAVLPVHWTGRPADMTAIMSIAKKHHLAVIEDCAQAVCAEHQGQKVGSFGHAGCFSLHPLKTLNACGDGGVLTTNDPDIYEKVRILRDNGFRTREECVMWSNNSRLDTIQAAILMVKFKYLDGWTEKRRENARFYQDHLSDLSEVQTPVDEAGTRAVYHTFVIQADVRDRLKAYLEEKSVGTKIHYPVPLHLQPFARGLGYKRNSLPVTEKQAGRILSLPVYPELGKDGLSYVAQCIHEFYRMKGKK
ncbi:MAG: DegT/DnrJ/EryC1/StrS family aminotransferase [Candidatus Omnitrophica bacterium]|nr:DegT/DnrJ/EryC1/StrS family aminotransferase [Candidatus Omnitrophota bacterium]